MGAWGAGSFENDDAMDWVAGLTQESGDAVLREALAPARDDPSASLPDEVVGWANNDSADAWRAAMTDLRSRLD